MNDFIGSWPQCVHRITLRSLCPISASTPCPTPPGGRLTMAKDAKTEFYYYIKGKPYHLTPGEDGVTEEIITVLRDSYHTERLNDRYADENQNHLIASHQSLRSHNPIHQESPIDRLPDLSQAPEVLLFSEEFPPSIRDHIHDLIPLLIPAQQELFWKLCEGQKLVDIARTEGTTDNAIRSRRKKMIKRLKSLYIKTYEDF